MVEEKTVVRDQSLHPTGELGTLVTAGNADNTIVTTKNRKFVRSDFGQISPSIPGLEGPSGTADISLMSKERIYRLSPPFVQVV